MPCWRIKSKMNKPGFFTRGLTAPVLTDLFLHLPIASRGPASCITMVTAAYYPVNDTSLSAGERAYLQQLEAYAEHQDLEQDLRPETRILSLAFTVLAAFVVGLRFLARQRQHAPYGVDDWLILVALALLGGNLAFNMVMIGEGLGLHSGRLTIEELMKLNQVCIPLSPWNLDLASAGEGRGLENASTAH